MRAGTQEAVSHCKNFLFLFSKRVSEIIVLFLISVFYEPGDYTRSISVLPRFAHHRQNAGYPPIG